MTTDGQFKITNTYSGKWHNPEAITNTKITDFPGYTNTITKVIEPNELIVENNDESTVTFDYDGFGVRLNFIQPEEGGDVLSAESFGLQTKATPVGKRTTTETSQGNSSVASKSKQTETNYFPGLSWNFMHEHRAESLTISDWDVGDEWVLEFLSGGGSTVTYTPSGTTNTHRSLDTQGEYQWRNDRVLPSGPYSGALARNWGESEYFSNGQLNHGVTRSGSVSATYDDEGNAVSASGSLQLAHTYSGTAISYISAWGKSVLGSESSTGTMVVATRNFTQGRNGSFNGGETSTLTPQINSEGNIVFDTSSTGLTGTRSGSQTTTDVRSVYEIYNGTVQTSGNLYSLTDSGESPPGGGPSINYLLPSTDFADDPPPEQNASLSTGGLGYFASAFGFRGGIVGATFATALPGDPTIPGSTNFGELDFGGNYLLKDPNPDDPPGTTYIFDQLDGDMSVGVVATDKKYETKTIIYTDRTFWGAFWGDDTGYDVLDGSTDFFAGWADFLTLGGSSYVRYWTGSSEFVNEDSGWYLAGGLTGTLVVAVASGGAGFGMLASRGVVGGLLAYDAVSALHGMGKSTYNAYKGTFTGWDLLSYLPIAGYGIGKFGKHVGGRSLGNTAGKVDDVVAANSAVKGIADQVSGPGQRLAGQIDSLAQSGLTGAKRLRPDELATGRRLEHLLGRRLRESGHEGADFVDDFGRTFDALGGGSLASQFFKPQEFFDSIRGHLLKSNDFTVIDLTGFTSSQIAQVRTFLNGLSQSELDRIIRIGF